MKIVSKDLLKPGDKAPKIEFPCDYPIKIMGDSHETFIDRVVAVVQNHAPELDKKKVKVKESSKGTFVSVTVVIKATGEQQLEAIFTELKTLDIVKMVL